MELPYELSSSTRQKISLAGNELEQTLQQLEPLACRLAGDAEDWLELETVEEKLHAASSWLLRILSTFPEEIDYQVLYCSIVVKSTRYRVIDQLERLMQLLREQPGLSIRSKRLRLAVVNINREVRWFRKSVRQLQDAIRVMR